MISTKINIDTSGIIKAFDLLEKEGKLTANYIDKVFSENITIDVNDSQLTNLPKVAKQSFDKVESEAKGMFASLKESLNLGSILNFAAGDLVADGIAKVGEGIGFLAEQASRADEIGTQMENGFRLAGLAGASLDKQLQETTDYARSLGNELGIAPERIKELSATAGALGGATGKMNKDLTKLAVGIESATNGAISGESAIKIFSRGISDPENAEAIDKLKKSFPQLGDALLTAGTPAEKLQASLGALSGTFTTMINDTSDVEARFGIFKNNIAEGAQAIGGAFLSSFNTDKLVEAFSKLGGGVDIFKVLENAGTVLGETLTNVLNTFISLVQTISNSPLFQTLKNNFELVSVVLLTYLGYTKAIAYETEILATKTKLLAIVQGAYNTIMTLGTALMTAYSNGTILATAKTYLMTTAQTLLNAVMNLNPIGLIVIALGALTAGLVYAYKNSESFRKVIDSVWETMKGWLKTLGSITTSVLEFLGILGKDTNIKKNVKVDVKVESTANLDKLNKEISNLIQKNNAFELNKKQFEDTQNAIKRNIDEQKKLGKLTEEQYQTLSNNLDAIEFKKKEKEKKEKKGIDELKNAYDELYKETVKLAEKQDFGTQYEKNIKKLEEFKQKIKDLEIAKGFVDFRLDDIKVDIPETTLFDFKKEINKYFENEEIQLNTAKFSLTGNDGIDPQLLVGKKTATELEKSLSNIFVDTFKGFDYTSIFKKRNEEVNVSLDKDRASLLSSLQKNEIDYEEYASRLNEIDSQRLDTSKQKNSEFVNALNETLSMSFGAVTTTVNETLNTSMKDSEAFTTNLTDNIGLALATIGSATLDMASSGENLLKSLAVNTLKTARAMFNAYLAPLLLKELLEKPFGAGFLTFTAYSILGNSLLGVAEGLVGGFKDGVINLQGAGTSRSDSIPAMLSRGESVINARSSAINEPYLRYVNNGGSITNLLNTAKLEGLMIANNNILMQKEFSPRIVNENRFNVSSNNIRVIRGR
jgi:hypothetical protein